MWWDAKKAGGEEEKRGREKIEKVGGGKSEREMER